MGRNAGWLTGASILAKGEDCEGPDLIYLPEVPFDIAKFKERVEKLLKSQHSVVVCVSEGIHTKEGTYICEFGDNVEFVDAFNHKQLTGTAAYVCNYIA